MKVISSDIPELKIGDLIVKVNNVDLNSDQARTLNAAYRNLTRNNKPGEKWTVTYKSEGETKQMTVELVTGTRKSKKVVARQDATPEQLKLRKQFESKKR